MRWFKLKPMKWFKEHSYEDKERDFFLSRAAYMAFQDDKDDVAFLTTHEINSGVIKINEDDKCDWTPDEISWGIEYELTKETNPEYWL